MAVSVTLERSASRTSSAVEAGPPGPSAAGVRSSPRARRYVGCEFRTSGRFPSMMFRRMMLGFEPEKGRPVTRWNSSVPRLNRSERVSRTRSMACSTHVRRGPHQCARDGQVHLIKETGDTEVHQPRHRRVEDVLGLQIAVDDLKIVVPERPARRAPMSAETSLGT